MQSFALALALVDGSGRCDRGRNRTAGARPDSPPRRAASLAATEICSERSNISAHMCLMAWKLPIGFAELLAHLRVFGGGVKRPARQARGLGGKAG